MGKFVLWLCPLALLLFASCSSQPTIVAGNDIEVHTGLEVEAGPVTVGVSINQYGEVTLSGDASFTLIGKKGLASLNWTVGVEKTFNEARGTRNNLFIIWQDEQDEVWQAQYQLDRPFTVQFSQQDWVREIRNMDDGTVLVFVEKRLDSSGIDSSAQRDYDPVSSCPGAAPSQVRVGQTVRVCTKSDHLIMRMEPNRGAPEIRRFDPGTEFTVLAGPECSDNSQWFFVKTEKYNKKGWVREGSDEIDPYFICTVQ